MTTTAGTTVPFAFVGDGHPFAAALDRMRARLPADITPGELAHCEIQGELHPDGHWTLGRAYLSRQGGRPFRADTLVLGRGDTDARRVTFPDEPYLPAARAWLAARPGHRVLRYVPLRRLTVTGREPGGRQVVTKFKRRSRLRDSWGRTAAVAAAADRHPGLRVAAVLGVDDATSTYVQEHVRGLDLAALTTATDLTRVLAVVGAVHARLHRLPVAGLPRRDADADLTALLRTLRWIALFRPDLDGWLHRVAAALLATRPEAGPETTCHGDFVCSHLLTDRSPGDLDPGAVTVIDLDLAAVGEPCHDIGYLLASLTEDVPLLAGHAQAGDRATAAATAYLDGYRAAGGTPDPRRLLWYRATAELHRMGLAFSKDRYDPVRFDASATSVGDLLDELGGRGCGR